MDNEIVKEEEVIAPQPAEETVTESASLPGEKTDSALLLKSLQEERAKRKELEAELALKTAPAGEVFSDEGKLIDGKVQRLEKELADMRFKEQLSAVQTSYPALKDKAAEFEQYLEENKGIRMDVAAKAFLVDKGLIETAPRKGLEKDTGGGRTPVKSGMSPEEIDDLRVNNYNEYRKRVKNGTLGLN